LHNRHLSNLSPILQLLPLLFLQLLLFFQLAFFTRSRLPFPFNGSHVLKKLDQVADTSLPRSFVSDELVFFILRPFVGLVLPCSCCYTWCHGCSHDSWHNRRDIIVESAQRGKGRVESIIRITKIRWPSLSLVWVLRCCSPWLHVICDAEVQCGGRTRIPQTLVRRVKIWFE
jgi:hypothetical protein